MVRGELPVSSRREFIQALKGPSAPPPTETPFLQMIRGELPVSSGREFIQALQGPSTSSPTETPFLKFIRGKLPISSGRELIQALQGQSNFIGKKQNQSAPMLIEDELQDQYRDNLAETAKPILPESANNPFYSYPIDVMPARKPDDLNYLEYADGGRIGYAMGNSVQEGIMAAPQIASQMGMPVGNPRMNEGGVPELDYRDEGGFVPPIGIKERADDIPAMLSNNEFVFTADAVKNAGGGDPNVGAQKMYTLMKRLESGGRV